MKEDRFYVDRKFDGHPIFDKRENYWYHNNNKEELVNLLNQYEQKINAIKENLLSKEVSPEQQIINEIFEILR